MNLLFMFSTDDDDQQPRSQGISFSLPRKERRETLGMRLDDLLKWQSGLRSKEVAKRHLETLQRDRYCQSFNRWH